MGKSKTVDKKLVEKINNSFGSVDSFKEKFSAVALDISEADGMACGK